MLNNPISFSKITTPETKSKPCLQHEITHGTKTLLATWYHIDFSKTTDQVYKIIT